MLLLRLEKPCDHEIVERITYEAFKDAPPTGSGDDGSEALLAHKLRSCPDFVRELDFVAEAGGNIVGNIMYSKSKIAGDSAEWEALTFGPVSVSPAHQRQGIGSALIKRTLNLAREMGYRAVLIFGHEKYYPRFSFENAANYGITTSDGKNFPAFMVLPLYGGALDGVSGRLILSPVFSSLDKAEAAEFNKQFESI